LKMVSIMQRF